LWISRKSPTITKWILYTGKWDHNNIKLSCGSPEQLNPLPEPVAWSVTAAVAATIGECPGKRGDGNSPLGVP